MDYAPIMKHYWTATFRLFLILLLKKQAESKKVSVIKVAALLKRMLSEHISSWCIRSGYVSACFGGGHFKFHIAFSAHISSWRMLSGARTSSWHVYAQRTDQFLTCMLSVCISSLRACWGYTKSTFEKTGKLRVRIRNWCIWSGCASFPDAHAQCTHKFLICMLSVRIKVGAYA